MVDIVDIVDGKYSPYSGVDFAEFFVEVFVGGADVLGVGDEGFFEGGGCFFGDAAGADELTPSPGHCPGLFPFAPTAQKMLPMR